MKILILSFYYQPDLCAGSFRCTALVEQLKQYAGDNIEIDVISTLPNRYSSFAMNAEEYEKQDSVRIRRIALPKHYSGMMDQAKVFLHFAKEVRTMVQSEEYTLVFATSSRLMTATLGAWIARKKQAKLYLDIRDIFVDTIGDILSKKLSFILKPIFSCVERWTYKQASHVNLVSLGFKPYFTKKCPDKPLSFFTNGIDNEFINAAKEQQPSDLKTRIPLTAVYAGNIGEGQGLHLIIPTLAKQLEGRVHFKILGDGGKLNKLKKALSTFECANVELLPPVKRASLIETYNEADILFLHLNNHEAFKKVLPSKLFEYAALGKPIWAGVAGYPAEFIKTEISNAEVFAPGDSIGAEEALNKLIIATTIRSSFIEKYSRPKIMQQMGKDILSLIEECNTMVVP
ncbi:MAG: glycosyltransferase family 4 protein [Legionella sp.]|nr:glycosyltransferase family 4 protein [Legionella sp.]